MHSYSQGFPSFSLIWFSFNYFYRDISLYVFPSISVLFTDFISLRFDFSSFKQSYVSPSILFLLLATLHALLCLPRASGSRHHLPFYDAEQERRVVCCGDVPCADSLWPPPKSCTGDERNNSSEWTVIGHLLLEHARGILAWFISTRWTATTWFVACMTFMPLCMMLMSLRLIFPLSLAKPSLVFLQFTHTYTRICIRTRNLSLCKHCANDEVKGH